MSKPLPKDWESLVISEYNNGASDPEVAQSLQISMPRFRDLYASDPHFQRTVDTGRGYAQAWWLREGRVNLKDKSFNYSGWLGNMKHRYGWNDKSELVVDNKVPSKMSDTDITREIELLKNKLLKGDAE